MSDEIRTQVNNQFDSMMDHYKRERAKYASKIRSKKEKDEESGPSVPKYHTKEGRRSRKEMDEEESGPSVPRYYTKEGRKKLSLNKKQHKNNRN